MSYASWQSLAPGSCVQNNCKTIGFNVGNKANVRIGIVGNDENSCSSPDSLIGFGGWVGDFGTSGISFGAFTEKTSPCGAKKILPWGYVFAR